MLGALQQICRKIDLHPKRRWWAQASVLLGVVTMVHSEVHLTGL
jgi:hypothetical protein